MNRRNPMKLPTSQRFWREWLHDPTEFNTFMDDGALADLVSHIINMHHTSAVQPAAVVWWLCELHVLTIGGKDQPPSELKPLRVELAIQAGERWLELQEIAAESIERKDLAAKVIERMRAEWAPVRSWLEAQSEVER